MEYIQQGDIVMIPVSKIPLAAEKDASFEGIVQYGERTGHKHRLTGKEKHMFHYFHEGRRYLELKEASELKHEEHHPICLAPGNYEVRIVREYDHFADLVRPVVD